MSHFKAKMHQIRFPLDLSPRPHWRAHSAPPDTPGLLLRGGRKETVREVELELQLN